MRRVHAHAAFALQHLCDARQRPEVVQETVRLRTPLQRARELPQMRFRDLRLTPSILATSIPVSVPRLLLIWLERVVLTILITAPIAHLLF